MNLNKLIVELSQKGVQIGAEENQLRIRAPKGILTPELQNLLSESKEELLKLLNQNVNEITKFSSKIIQANPKEKYQPFPLTDLQQGYWVGRSGLLELSVGSCYYLEIESNNLEVQQLSSVWQKLIERHDMLRTIVLSTGEQQILKQVFFEGVKIFDFRECSRDIVATELEKIRQEMSRHSQSSEQWPLFKIRASQLDKKTVRLHLSFDLLIIDGRSLQILIQEMAELLKDYKAVLPPLELSFRDYALSYQSFKNSEDYQQALEYWHNRIPKLPSGPELPLAKQPSSLKDYHFSHLATKLSPDTWLQIKTKATQKGLTPTLVVFAAYAEVLKAWSRNPHFTLIFLYSNRLSAFEQVNNIVGNFNSTILVEINHSYSDNFEVKAKNLQRQFWNDQKHNLVSGIQVIREINRLQGERYKATIPVTFGSEISDNNIFKSKHSDNLSEFIQVYNCLQVPQVFLDHQISIDANGALTINWDFVKALFPENLIETMFDVYIHFLERLAWEDEIWQQAAQAVINSRLNDGSNEFGNLSPSGIPFSDYTTPFALSSGDQLRPTEGPIKYSEDPAAYIQQAEEILDFSANLTDKQKAIAEFWAAGLGTVSPLGLWHGVTPPFPEFVSGHSTFSGAAAEILKLFTRSDAFGGSRTITTSLIEPDGFATPITLQWDTFSDALEEAGISRLYGGIHFNDGNLVGQSLGRQAGNLAWNKAQSYIQGTISIREPNFTLGFLLLGSLGMGLILKNKI